MKDRTGFEYADLVAIQRTHLARWQEVLRPSIFAEVKEYVVASNQETFSAEGRHRVYRGQDLVEIIRLWPTLSDAYAPKPVESAASLI